MPLKDIKEPKEPKEPKSKPGKDEPKPTADTTTEAWKYNDDGSKVRQGRKLPFENQLRDLFDTAAGAVKLADSFSGEIIGNQAEELAYGYAKLAKEDPRIKAFFEKMVTGTAYSAVAIPTALTVIPILWHFGVMPGKVGVPATLAAGMIPFTREEEQAALAAQQAQQAQPAQSDTPPPTHPRGEDPPSAGEQPSS